MFRVVGAAIFGVALVLNVVGVATSAWIASAVPGFHISFGIFDGYVTNTVAAVFNILGDLMLIGAMAGAITSHLQKKEGKNGMIGGFLGIAAGVLIVVGVGNFTREYLDRVTNSPLATWGYSFILCWTSFVLALLGGGLALITK